MLERAKYIPLFLLTSIIASCQSTSQEIKPIEKINENGVLKETVIVLNNLDTITYVYSWKNGYDYSKSLANNIDLPQGYHREKPEERTFASWLRHLPLSPDDKVYLYNGEEKYNQSAQYRVLDINIGDKDLQQCADAVMRLRAEYLYATNQYDKIHFKYTNGVNIPFLKWSNGYYPSLKRNKVVWTSSSNNKSYNSFKKYITNIFMYAGTASLEKEMESIDLSEIKAGDVFIKGGFPGHAVIVLDVAIDKKTADKAFLIAQSYMPAQSIHILNNPNSNHSPWYSLAEISDVIKTPEWDFYSNQLKRFIE